MRTSTHRITQVSIVFALMCAWQLAGCASSGDPAKKIEHPNPVLPQWVSSPHIEGSMVYTDCVDANAPMSILKGKAAMLARAGLASELRARLAGLKTYLQEQNATEAGATFSEDYDRKMEALQEETLTGSRVARADYVTVNGEREFCAMVVIDKANTDRLVKGVNARIESTNSDLDQHIVQRFLLKDTRERLESGKE